MGQSERRIGHAQRPQAVETEAPIQDSNVQLVYEGTGRNAKTTRVGYDRVEVTKRRPDGTEYTTQRSVRVARKTGKEI